MADHKATQTHLVTVGGGEGNWGSYRYAASQLDAAVKAALIKLERDHVGLSVQSISHDTSVNHNEYRGSALITYTSTQSWGKSS